jgi:hypothetical protein
VSNLILAKFPHSSDKATINVSSEDMTISKTAIDIRKPLAVSAFAAGGQVPVNVHTCNV